MSSLVCERDKYYIGITLRDTNASLGTIQDSWMRILRHLIIVLVEIRGHTLNAERNLSHKWILRRRARKKIVSIRSEATVQE